MLGFMVAAPRRSPPRSATRCHRGSVAGAGPAHRPTCERWSRRVRGEADYQRPDYSSGHCQNCSGEEHGPANDAGAAKSRRKCLFSSFSGDCATSETSLAPRCCWDRRSPAPSCCHFYLTLLWRGACRTTMLHSTCFLSRKNCWQ